MFEVPNEISEIRSDVVRAQLQTIQECTYEIDREKVRVEKLIKQKMDIGILFSQLYAVCEKNKSNSACKNTKQHLTVLEDAEALEVSMLRGKVSGLDKAVNFLEAAFNEIYKAYAHSLKDESA